MNQASFTDNDVEVFLDDHLVERCDICNLGDDHPFRNPWHNGTWIDVARELFAEHREEFGHVRDPESFITAVGKLAMYRGYDDGVPKWQDDADEIGMLQAVLDIR
jgi:hypothetical protein